MTPSAHVRVTIDLDQVCRNVESVRRQIAGGGSPVDLIAVVKADAYGLGADQVARAIAPLVDGFYAFDLGEVASAGLAETGLSTIVLRATSIDPSDYSCLRVRPVVMNVAHAEALKSLSPVLSVDTGQQRFGVPLNDAAAIDAILRAGEIKEAFTHATRVDQAIALRNALQDRVPKLHAAGSALLDHPAAHLNAVRPGLALYDRSVSVSTPLIEVTDSTGPAGYSGFQVARHGVILAGYSNGLRPGPCAINGRPSRILEVGMQSAFVECAASDAVGDEVELLGGDVSSTAVAAAWGCSPQEVLLRMSGLGPRRYAPAHLRQ